MGIVKAVVCDCCGNTLRDFDTYKMYNRKYIMCFYCLRDMKEPYKYVLRQMRFFGASIQHAGERYTRDLHGYSYTYYYVIAENGKVEQFIFSSGEYTEAWECLDFIKANRGPRPTKYRKNYMFEPCKKENK